MGIAKFFRWVSERYPLINQKITEVMMMPEFGEGRARHPAAAKPADAAWQTTCTST